MRIEPNTVGRRGVAAGSVILLAAMMWPAVSPSEIDSLPLSNYPMFARERPRESRIDTVALIQSDGTRVRLDASDIGGTDQPVQAFRTVQQAIRTDAVDELCAEIVARLDPAARIEVVSEHYDAIDWFAGEHVPISREVHAECTKD